VKNFTKIALLMALVLSSCTEVGSLLPPTPRQYGYNDYAVGEAQPYPQEVILAKKRLVNFIRRARSPRQKQVLEENPYVAVQAGQLVAGEIWPLMRELASGRVRTNHYIYDLENTPNYPVEFVLLFDQQTQRLVRPDGVLIMTDPQRGSVADFAGVKAIYAGAGWW
jgi:hypothetical protein